MPYRAGGSQDAAHRASPEVRFEDFVVLVHEPERVEPDGRLFHAEVEEHRVVPGPECLVHGREHCHFDLVAVRELAVRVGNEIGLVDLRAVSQLAQFPDHRFDERNGSERYERDLVRPESLHQA